MTSCGGRLKQSCPEHPLSHHLSTPANGLLCLCLVKCYGKSRQPWHSPASTFSMEMRQMMCPDRQSMGRSVSS